MLQDADTRTGIVACDTSAGLQLLTLVSMYYMLCGWPSSMWIVRAICEAASAFREGFWSSMLVQGRPEACCLVMDAGLT